VRNGAYFYKKWLRGACGLKARIVKKVRKKDWGGAAGEPGEEKKNTSDKEGGGTGENKGGGIKRGIKKGIGEGINRWLLFKKKEGFVVLFFLRRLRPRPLSPRLRNVILSVKAIKLKKGLIKNKIKIYNNAKKVRPGYANKIKY